MSLNTIPTELKDRILEFLPLKGIIIMRGVTKEWRRTIDKNLDSGLVIDPARASFFRLWQKVIQSPYFLPSRKQILPYIRQFDRQRYVNDLIVATPFDQLLPEDFTIWLCEWPAKAVIGKTWPTFDYIVWRPSHHHFSELAPLRRTHMQPVMIMEGYGWRIRRHYMVPRNDTALNSPGGNIDTDDDAHDPELVSDTVSRDIIEPEGLALYRDSQYFGMPDGFARFAAELMKAHPGPIAWSVWLEMELDILEEEYEEERKQDFLEMDTSQ